MSVKSEQRLAYSSKRVDKQATADGGQSVIQTGYVNHYVYWAWFVAKDELNDSISGALPPEYGMEGQPSVVEIERIQHYNVVVRGISYTDEPLSPAHEAAHSGSFG